MATARGNSSTLARLVVLALACWSACPRSVDFAPSGATAGPRAARALSPVRRRWSIFENFELPAVGGQVLSPDEVGTRSQREVDAQARQVECSLPLGIEFEEKDGGDIYVKSVEQGTDAWEQGVRPGAQLTMISATFGEEMWTTRKVGMSQFTQTLNSRFGSTISIALEKEDQGILQNLFAAKAPKHETEEDRRRQADMAHVFEREEATLQHKSMWSFFR